MKNNWVTYREAWWREMVRSPGAISAMIADLAPRDLKSVVEWGAHILKTRPEWYKEKHRKVSA